MKENSSIKVGDENEFGDGVIVGNHNNNHITINKQNNSSVSYEGNRENVYFLNKISPLLIQRFGNSNLKLVSIISILASMLTISTWINSINSEKVIPFIPQITSIKPEWLMYVGIFLFVLFSFTAKVVSHHTDTKCKKCKKEFAYDEYKAPSVEEFETSKGTRIHTTRYYECKYCGDQKQSKIKKIIQND